MKLVLSVLLAGLAFSGCVVKPQMSPQQRRALQKRSYDYSMKNVFNAFKTVLQDEGYIIRNQDYAGGMILAEKQRAANNGGAAFLSILAGGRSSGDYTTSEGYTVSVSLEGINKSTTETRMTLEKVSRSSRGGQSGGELLDPVIYKSLYQKIDVELKRRAAQGK